MKEKKESVWSKQLNTALNKTTARPEKIALEILYAIMELEEKKQTIPAVPIRGLEVIVINLSQVINLTISCEDYGNWEEIDQKAFINAVAEELFTMMPQWVSYVSYECNWNLFNSFLKLTGIRQDLPSSGGYVAKGLRYNYIESEDNKEPTSLVFPHAFCDKTQPLKKLLTPCIQKIFSDISNKPIVKILPLLAANHYRDSFFARIPRIPIEVFALIGKDLMELNKQENATQFGCYREQKF
jgi:hypothetical protein